jgi:hypothetical protein
MSEDPKEIEVSFDQDEGFFEPTIEESIMASGLHKQYIPHHEDATDTDETA